VLGDYLLGSDATLRLPSAAHSLRIEGDFDAALADNARYDLALAELRMIGLGQGQSLEVMSADIGPDPSGLDRDLPGRYPVGTLRIGPAPTVVNLLDNHDNDNQGQASPEAIYVDLLVIDQGATLNTGPFRVYYRTLVLAGDVDDPSRLVQITSPCPGDLTGDGQVDLTDLSILLAHFGTLSGAEPDDGDLDGDGDVDLTDLSLMLGGFGLSCD